MEKMVALSRSPKGRDASSNGENATAKGGAAAHAYRVLREEIIQRLPPGSSLDEELFTRLGLSRTPVREAIARLAGERLVELLPNRGARVAPMGWPEVREHLEALDVLQRVVTRLAARRRTERDLANIERERLAFEAAAASENGVEMTEANWRFHTAIGASCRNSIFERSYRQVLTEGLRIDRHAMFEESFASREGFHRHAQEIVDDHRDMAEAIREGDETRAEEGARRHAELARRRLTDFVTGSVRRASAVSVDFSLEDADHV
jgi:DNA-binding GntR family transcriptional regulator